MKKLIKVIKMTKKDRMGWVVCSGVEWWAGGRCSFAWRGGVREGGKGAGSGSRGMGGGVG